MPKTKIAILLICFFVQDKLVIASDHILFENKKIYYAIVTASRTKEELAAANKLANYLTKQSVPGWKVDQASVNSDQKQIVIRSTSLPINEQPGCRIYAKDRHVVIEAPPVFLATAVSFFLESFTGCRVYSDTVQFVPKLNSCLVPEDFDKTFSPAFPIRLLYDWSAFKADFIDWHGLSNLPGPVENNKSFGWGLWVHTFFDLVPPKLYFKSHPEYYSLRDNKRVTGQLCLSNKEVVKVAIENLKKLVTAKPDAKYWSISQMDNELYCECVHCNKIVADEKSQSGCIVRFVNEIAKQFPGKIISTLAYQYSKQAPIITRPLDNVAVIFCFYEADRSMPLTANGINASLRKDFEDWLRITKNMMVWDYTVNLVAIPGPFPNLATLQPNLQYFQKCGLKMVFEQGWPWQGGGLQDYRAYLLAKLLWDPFLDVNSLKRDFFSNFYGSAGLPLMQVVDLMEAQFHQSGKTLTMYEDLNNHSNGFLEQTLRDRYNQLIGEALENVKNDLPKWKRVDAFAQAFRFADIELDWARIGKTEWVNNLSAERRISFKKEGEHILNEFVAKSKLYGPPTIRENALTPTEWKGEKSSRFKIDAESNAAKNARLAFKNSYVPDFAGAGKNALIDGVSGTDDWSSTWQGWSNNDINAILTFEQPKDLTSFKMRFMKDPPYNLVVPVEVKVLISSNGVSFTQIANIKRPAISNSDVKEVISFESTFSKPVKARYMQVIATWPGFTKEGKGSFMFTDEIFVK